MLEFLDLKAKLPKETWKAEKYTLQNQLYDAYQACWHAKIPVIIILEGVDGSGKARCIKFLTERQDPRGYQVNALSKASEAESKYPWLHRYWNILPEYGEISFFHTSWYRRLFGDFVAGAIQQNEARLAIRDIVKLERALTQDGTILIKFMVHISAKEQRKRLKSLEVDSFPGWYFKRDEWLDDSLYDRWVTTAEPVLRETESAWGPWQILAATDLRHARFTMTHIVLDKIKEHLTTQGHVITPIRHKPDPEPPPPS